MISPRPGEDYLAVVQTGWTIASYIVTTAAGKHDVVIDFLRLIILNSCASCCCFHYTIWRYLRPLLFMSFLPLVSSLISVLLPPMLDSGHKFVLRTVRDLTRENRNFLRSGNNDLIQLAFTHTGLSETNFLEAVFEGEWNMVAAPNPRPIKPARMAAEATMPCAGVLATKTHISLMRFSTFLLVI